MQRKIRQSQTIVPFGVGAIFDLQGESLVACDTFRWGPRGERIQSERLAAVLGVSEFRAAPAVDQQRLGRSVGRCALRPLPRVAVLPEVPTHDPLDARARASGQGADVRQLPRQEAAGAHALDPDLPKRAHGRHRLEAVGALAQHQPRSAAVPEGQPLLRDGPGKGAGGLDTLQVHCHSCHSRRNLMGIT